MPSATPKALTVLCVEGDPDIRTIIALSLRLDANMEAELFATVAEMVSRLEQGIEADVVLAGAIASAAMGVHLLDRIRRLARGVTPPVILLTADVRDREIESYMAAGALGVIEKPFHPLELAARIRALVPAPG